MYAYRIWRFARFPVVLTTEGQAELVSHELPSRPPTNLEAAVPEGETLPFRWQRARFRSLACCGISPRMSGNVCLLIGPEEADAPAHCPLRLLH